MTYNVKNLWPVPIYVEDIGIKNDTLKFAESCEYERMENDNGCFTKDKYILNSLPSLKHIIYKSCINYVKDVLLISENAEFYFQNSWIVRHGKNDYAQEHTHAGSIISGVYYIDVPKNGGDFYLIKNDSHINTFYPNINFDYSGSDDTTNKKVKFLTRNGLLILFPSQITHSTDKTLSTKYRYSLAFNMFCKGKFGKDEYELEIK